MLDSRGPDGVPLPMDESEALSNNGAVDTTREADGMTRHVVDIPEAHAGRRLDQALSALLPTFSRARLQSLIEAGQVTDDHGQVLSIAKSKVRLGQRIVVAEPPPEPAIPEPEDIPLNIIYEDDAVLVIEKPSGMVVHPAPGNLRGTLVNAVLHHCKGSLSGIGGVERPGIVHRLDKDTSGLMVVAKTDQAHRHLAAQFERHSLTRAYKALVWGVPNVSEGTVDGPIGRDPKNRKRMAVVSEGRGKAAVTHYRVLDRVARVASILECRLETGRTHQIRVHLSRLGHAVVGDALYAGRKDKKRNDALFDHERFKQVTPQKSGQILHAYKLGFEHPTATKLLQFDSMLPSYFEVATDVIRLEYTEAVLRHSPRS